MKDNDIIKALEFCESLTCECTSWCPMFYNGTNSKSDCRSKLHKDAIDLINRQKAEIERLEAYNANLEAANSHMSNTLLDEVAKARAEAIKEFAERLKQTRVDLDGIEMVAVGNIDAIAQEMTEE